MAYMETAHCLCCGEGRTIMKDPMRQFEPYDPYCSEHCRKRAELGKCEVMEKIAQAPVSGVDKA